MSAHLPCSTVYCSRRGTLLTVSYACAGNFLHACSIFQDRLQRAAEQQPDSAAAAAADGVNDAAGAAAAEPSVSFFGLIKEGRLSRNQAAKLFYQVCGKCGGPDLSRASVVMDGRISAPGGKREPKLTTTTLSCCCVVCSDHHWRLCVSGPGAPLW